MQEKNQILKEGLEQGDLERLVDPYVTLDEYKSKMGSDDEILVVSFKVDGKNPALDLVNFIEKSYEWIIDADVSSGEMTDGSFIVFVEIERDIELPDHLMKLFDDLKNLTGLDVDDWNIEYSKPKKKITLDVDSIRSIVPMTPEEYRNKNKQMKNDIDQLKIASGVDVDTTAPKNDFTEAIRIAAGII